MWNHDVYDFLWDVFNECGRLEQDAYMLAIKTRKDNIKLANILSRIATHLQKVRDLVVEYWGDLMYGED